MNNDRPLQSPILRHFIVLTIMACSLAFTSPLFAVDAGRFMVVVGDVRVVDENGQSQPAIRGSLLSSGDTVVTGENALAQLSMVDNGRISLRENTEFKLDEYNFKQEEPSAGRMFVNLLRGSFRSLTGLIGSNNRAGYRVRTPHATLGVRGTDHETTVILAPRDGFDPGTFDVVFQGRTVLRTAQGQIEISPRQAGYVGAANPVPRIITIPAFLQAAPSARAPTPAQERPQAAAKSSPQSSSDKTGRIDRNKALLNPLSDSKLQSPTRTTTTTTLESPTLRTLDSTTLKTLVPSTTTRTLDSSTLESSTTLKTLDSSTLKSLDTSTTRTLDSSTLKSLDTSTILKSPTTTTTSPKLTSPTRTISPTLTAPTTTISPKVTAPTTTTSPTLTAPKTTISPTLTSPTR